MLSDAELLSRYAHERSETAFAEIVTRHLNTVYRAAFRQLDGNVHLAQEVAQTVFTQLARKAPSLPSSTVLVGWLYSATHYTVANVRRAEWRRIRREQEAFLMHQDQSAAGSAPEWERLRPVIDDVLWQLRPTDREAVLLRFFENRSYREIAGSLDLTENAARMRVERAVVKMRTLLARRKIVSSIAALEALVAQQTTVAAPAGLSTAIAQQAMSASAASGVAPAVHLLSTMAASKTALVGLSALALLTVGSTFYQFSEAEASAHNVADADTEYRQTLARVNAESDKLRAAEQTNTALTQRAATLAAARTDQAGTGGAPTAAGNPSIAATGSPAEAGRQFLNRHPNVRQALVDYGKAEARTQYGALYRMLGMTDDDIARFEDILSSQGGWGRSFPSGTLDLKLRSPDASDRSEAQLKALLGPERYERYRAYEGTLYARSLVENVASQTTESDSPLTPVQAQQLIEIFAKTRVDPNSSSSVWDKTIEQARTILMPVQIEQLQTLRTRTESWQRVIEASR